METPNNGGGAVKQRYSENAHPAITTVYYHPLHWI